MSGLNATGPTELLTHVDRIRERFELGIIDADDAAAALGRVHLVDTDGSAWTVGIRSRSWYRFRDGRWMAAGRAPDPANLVSGAELVASCPSCGAPSGGSRFCGECATPQAPNRLDADAERAIASFIETGYDTLPEPLPDRAARPEPLPGPRSVVPPTAPTPLTASAAPSTGAASGPTRPRRRIRAVLSTLIGAVLLLVSGSRLVVGLAGGAFEPPAATPGPSLIAGVEPDETARPSDPLPSAPVPPSGSAWFADAFDTEGAWPTGDDGLLGATYADGRYLLTAHPMDLPSYRWAANETTVGSAVTIESSIAFDTDGPTAVGLVVADAGAMNKLVVLIEPGGEWVLARDDIESFETLFAGRTDPLAAGTVYRLRLALDGAGTVRAWLDDVELASAAADLEVAQFGVAVWSAEDGGRVAVDDYLVTVP